MASRYIEGPDGQMLPNFNEEGSGIRTPEPVNFTPSWWSQYGGTTGRYGGTTGLVAPGWMNPKAGSGSLMDEIALFGGDDNLSFTPDQLSARQKFQELFPGYAQVSPWQLSPEGTIKSAGASMGQYLIDPSAVMEDPTYGLLSKIENFGYSGGKGGHGDAIKSLLAMAAMATGSAFLTEGGLAGIASGGSAATPAAVAGGMSQAELAAMIEAGTAGSAGAGLEAAGLAGGGLSAGQMATLAGGGSLNAPFSLTDALTRLAQGVTSGGGGGATGGGIPGAASKFDPISSGLSIVSGIYGMKRSNDLMKIAERAAAMQDPFGAQRPQYQAMLSQLMADPSKITTMPGYTAGMQAVERRLASQGYLGSGNMMTAMAEYGGSFFDKEANRLASLAGANIGPSGGGVLMQGANSSYDAASKALASLGFGVKDIARILYG